ncbi:hypothetical protein OK016_16905 [Vibrio chagasii]|nr:hypothetical protein [Vibrio chagasii]
MQKVKPGRLPRKWKQSIHFLVFTILNMKENMATSQMESRHIATDIY